MALFPLVLKIALGEGGKHLGLGKGCVIGHRSPSPAIQYKNQVEAEIELFLDPVLAQGDLAHDFLRGDVVVPEPWGVGFFLELGYFLFLAIDVKDTPGDP